MLRKKKIGGDEILKYFPFFLDRRDKSLGFCQNQIMYGFLLLFDVFSVAKPYCSVLLNIYVSFWMLSKILKSKFSDFYRLEQKFKRCLYFYWRSPNEVAGLENSKIEKKFSAIWQSPVLGTDKEKRLLLSFPI